MDGVQFSTKNNCAVIVRFCEGFRMPAVRDAATGTRAGVRKPSMDETAGWARGRSGLHYGDLSAAAGVRECGE